MQKTKQFFDRLYATYDIAPTRGSTGRHWVQLPACVNAGLYLKIVFRASSAILLREVWIAAGVVCFDGDAACINVTDQDTGTYTVLNSLDSVSFRVLDRSSMLNTRHKMRVSLSVPPANTGKVSVAASICANNECMPVHQSVLDLSAASESATERGYSVCGPGSTRPARVTSPRDFDAMRAAVIDRMCVR